MKIVAFLIASSFLCITSLAAPPAARLEKMTWQVDGETREALVYIPRDTSTKPPIVFAFHGHGGNAQNASRQFAFHTHWPEAICVYPQGLPTKTIVDPQGKLPGWQKLAGDDSDRDLHFFDAMLKTFETDHNADAARVYSAGFSNGAFFTYLLLSSRPDSITAIAPIAGLLSEEQARTAKPKPIFHVAGEKDPLVKFDQQEATIHRDIALDHCDKEGKPAGELCTEYTSPDGPPVVTMIHPGGHEVPKGAAERIVEFFKKH
jgi:polyhydroxybutyrate depolymerase